MSSTPLTIEQILTLLAEMPPRLATLTNGLQPAQLQTAPAHNGWSINDVLAHLRSCADVWGNCIGTILAEDTPTIRAMNPTTWITKTAYPEQDFRSSFHAYVTQRTALVAILEPLPPEAWSRSATVTGAGNVLVRTVQFYANWLATHERTHIKQIQRIVKVIPTDSSAATRE